MEKRMERLNNILKFANEKNLVEVHSTEQYRPAFDLLRGCPYSGYFTYRINFGKDDLILTCGSFYDINDTECWKYSEHKDNNGLCDYVLDYIERFLKKLDEQDKNLPEITYDDIDKKTDEIIKTYKKYNELSHTNNGSGITIYCSVLYYGEIELGDFHIERVYGGYKLSFKYNTGRVVKICTTNDISFLYDMIDAHLDDLMWLIAKEYGKAVQMIDA